MKILKYLFFLILIAIIAGAIYIATKDSKYQVEESIIISAPTPVVFNEVNNFENWESWGIFRNQAEDMILSNHEITRGEGGGFAWKSEDVGDGSLTTTRVAQNEIIEQELVHNPTFATSRGAMYWRFDEIEEGTLVTLGLEGSHSFKEKLAFAFREKSITQIMRERYRQGLENLRVGIINKMGQYSINVDGITTHGGGFYMYTTTASNIDQIPTKMPQMLTQVTLYMENNNITQQGLPMVIYNNWDDQNNSAIYSVAVFTPSLVITPVESSVLNGMMPVQKVVKITLNGHTDNLAEAWEKAYSYIEENNLKIAEDKQSFEVYKTTPETTLNPANWITEIYIPLTEAEVIRDPIF